LMGVFSPDWVVPISQALDALGLKSGIVAHGTPAHGVTLDELSCAGTNLISGFGDLKSQQGTLTAEAAKLPICDFSELAGGDVQENLKTMEALVYDQGYAVSPGLRNSVLLNAGAALWIAKKVDSLPDGVVMARDALERGQVARWLDQVRDFYQQA